MGVTTHGESRTKLYKKWKSLKKRCLNHNDSSFGNYGGRCISVCDAWLEYVPFRDWALENGYDENLEIDRIDNDGNYEPENCRFVTHSVNQNNKRKQRGSVSQFRGVHLHRKNNRWCAQVRCDGKLNHIGSYATEQEAARERDAFIINNSLPHRLNFKWFNEPQRVQ